MNRLPPTALLSQPTSVRAINRLRITSLVRRRPGMTRAEISQFSGLSKATVTNLVAELIEEGLLFSREPGEQQRRNRKVYLNRERGLAIGLELASNGCRGVLTDMASQTLRQTEYPLASTRVHHVVDTLQAVVTELLAGRDRPCLGLMIGVPGPVDESGQVLIFAEDLGWSDTPLARLVQAACGYPVALINRAQAGVWGERWLGTGKEQAADNLIYVSVSSGIGAGILLNGQLFTGAFGKAGELGHTTVLIDGEKCICGNHGCLETVASMRAVVQAVQTRFGTLPADQTVPLTAAQVIDRAKDGDSIAIQAVQEAGRYLGIAVANLIDLFNPATVIIGGQLAATGDLLLNPIREISQRRAFPLSYRHTQIVQNQLGPDSVCLGACTLVIDQFISAAVPALTPNDSIDTQ